MRSACTALLLTLFLHDSSSETCTTDIQDEWRAVIFASAEGTEMMARERAKGRNADRVKMCWFAITIPRRLLAVARKYYPACDPANTSEIERVQVYAEKAAVFARSNCRNQGGFR